MSDLFCILFKNASHFCCTNYILILEKATYLPFNGKAEFQWVYVPSQILIVSGQKMCLLNYKNFSQ